LSTNDISSQDLRAAARQPGGGVGAGIAVAVLSVDETLNSTLGEVVTADHTIAIAPDTATLAEQVMAVNAGVVLVDAEAVSGDIVAVLAQLRRQFPDLVLVAAGNSAHQGRLANMVTDGTVYRFLHKPVSAQRVRLFVEAALRRYDELRGAAAELRRAEAAVAASAAPPPKLPPKLLIGAAAGVAVLAAVLWFAFRGSDAPAPAAAVQSPVPPAPAAAAPVSAQDKRLTALLDDAEKALQANKLDVAGGLLAEAARIQPDNARLTFLTAEIAKIRERNALTQARSAAASGDYDKAFATLDAASAGDRTTLSEARRALSQQQGEERVRSMLKLGLERLRSGALVDPANDNARYYAQAVRTLAPRDAAGLRLQQAVVNRLLQEGRTTAARGEAAATDRWIAMAREDGATAAEVESVRRVLAEARTTQRDTEINRLAGLVRQRVSENRLLEPAEDSAQHWLSRIRTLDANAAPANELTQLLVSRLFGNARGAAERGDFDTAQRWLRSAESIAGRNAESAAVAADIAARQEKLARDNAVVGVSALKRTRFIEPTYPAAALARKVSGWVDLEFTVQKDGTVANIQIVNAQPGGMFDDAARSALSRWRFEPVQRDGATVEQRAKMRLRFNAPE
jgi:protein TonB